MGFEQRQVSTSSLAIAALVTGLTTSWCCPVVGALGTLILAFVALSYIRSSGGDLKGAGLAWAGVVLAVLALMGQVGFTFWMVGVYQKAEPVCESLVKALDAGDMEGVYALSVKEFRTAVPEQKLKKLADLVKDRLGAYKDKSWGYTLRVNYTPQGAIVFVVFSLRYEKGAGSGRFKLRICDDGSYKVLHFFIQSPKLSGSKL